MLRVFNCGIGMAVVVAEADVDAALAMLRGEGETVSRIGHIEAAAGPAEVHITFAGRLARMKQRAAVLFSGRGSNMAALVAASRDPAYPVEIVLALTNRGQALAGAGGCLGRADRGGGASAFPGDRAAHEAEIDAALRAAEVRIVCLAGYMRLLTPFLVDRWAGRMLNIHPSLLPAFPGLDTHPRALAAGVQLHGCTVHLVTQTMDEGPILAQAAVPVLPGDTDAALAARVLVQEHLIYPLALRLFATGQAGGAPGADAALRNPLPPAAALP